MLLVNLANLCYESVCEIILEEYWLAVVNLEKRKRTVISGALDNHVICKAVVSGTQFFSRLIFRRVCIFN